MLAAQREDGTFTDEEIVGNVFTLLIAGEDTTAHTMAWTSWFLARTPTPKHVGAEADVARRGPYPTDPEDRRAPLRRGGAQGVDAAEGRGERVIVEALTDTTIRDTRIPAGTRLILLFREARQPRRRGRVPPRALARRRRAGADVQKSWPSAPAPAFARGATSRFSSRRRRWR